MPLLSIIIPVYNEVDNIRPVCEEIDLCVKPDYEIILVDDGSTDGTYYAIEEQSIRDHRIKCISLSRNFGHQNALMAGMQYATGENIIIMDGDLQHPPSLIPKMLESLDQGNDLVITKRIQSGGAGGLKQLSSKIFYGIMNMISETRIEPNVADFKAFNRKVLNAVLSFKERDLFLRGIFSWVGFKSATLIFNAPSRRHGKTKYSYRKMTGLASKGITSFSFKPLRVALIIGTFISASAFGFGIFALVSYYNGTTVPGWASTIIAIMFLGGTQLLAIGLLGEYIASLFIETKQRPLFLVDKTLNL
ncbi:MAG TPA: glycosyltransferase family 2 protein [Ferruginibacter sp.]|nr:glycosyltransferase family 2 protein [Ferruginibacter sp.]